MKRFWLTLASLALAVGVGAVAYYASSSEMAGLVVGIVSLGLEFAGFAVHKQVSKKRARLRVSDSVDAVVEGIRTDQDSPDSTASQNLKKIRGGQYRGIVQNNPSAPSGEVEP
jgi:hypothetical protein